MQSPSVHLEVLARYGAPDPPPNSQYGGAAFAKITAVRALADGRVVALDPSYKKVALFDKSGKFIRTIGRGIGRGPGEFQRPIALDANAGRVAVFDYDGNRVTVFDTTGNLLWTRITPRARQIILVGDTVYGSHMPGMKYMVWRQAGADFESVTNLVPVSPRFLRDHDPNGAVAMLGRTEGGEVLVANGRPGFWYTISSRTVSPIKGVDLLNNAVFFKFEDMVLAPGEPWGIFPLSDRYLAIAFTTFKQSGNGRPSLATQELAVFDRRRDSLVARVDISGGAKVLPIIGPGPGPLEVLVGRTEPYPHIERAILRGLR
jgi:DNA-binding beta-propeller fold protein YncE